MKVLVVSMPSDFVSYHAMAPLYQTTEYKVIGILAHNNIHHFYLLQSFHINHYTYLYIDWINFSLWTIWIILLWLHP